MDLGLFLSSEEHPASDLIQAAVTAELSGVDRVLVSDHFHPWLESQGHSPFAWSVLGGIAATTGLSITTGVTCPTMRIHPAIIAQAAATMAELAPGRFRLGVGSGEALKEHILGDAWPGADTRLEMLEEAVEVMRELWKGEVVHHRGKHYTVEGARIYEAPRQPIPVIVSGFGPKAIELGARIGDGFVTVQPDADGVRRYRQCGGHGPRLGAMKVCWGPQPEEALKLAHDRWRNDGLPGELAQVLPMPAHFEQASALVDEKTVAGMMAFGPEPGPYLERMEAFADAGFDELYIQQIGPDQQGFLSFFERELRPAFGPR
jgi:G6PDH family F420-dependent oxidoreductase